MQKMKLIIIPIILLSGLMAITGACVNSTGAWVNCSSLLPSTQNGTGFSVIFNSILDNFPQTNINQTTGLPIQSNSGFFLILVGIGISEAVFIEVGSHMMGGGVRNELAVLNYVTICWLVTTLVFRMYSLVSGTAVDISISLVAISIIASIFFKGQG